MQLSFTYPILVNTDKNRVMIHFYFYKGKLTIIIEQAVNQVFAANTNFNHEPVQERKTMHSIRELSEFIGCSSVTAQRLKNICRIRYPRSVI